MKLIERAFDQYLICLIFPLRCAYFPVETSRTQQWVHLFLMNFTDFGALFLCFSLKCPFPMNKSSLNGKTIYMHLLSIRSSIRIKSFYSDDNFRCIMLRVSAFTLTLQMPVRISRVRKLRSPDSVEMQTKVSVAAVSPTDSPTEAFVWVSKTRFQSTFSLLHNISQF